MPRCTSSGDSRRGASALATTCDFRDFQDSSSLNWGLAYPDIRPDWSPHRGIRLRGTIPRWWQEIEPRLYELLELGTDWDPRGSRAVSLDDLEDALEFLHRVMRPDTRAPWIGPLASGGVEVAWRSGNVEVEAIFDRARDERDLIVCVGDNEDAAPIDHAESLFATVVDRLAAGDPVAA